MENPSKESLEKLLHLIDELCAMEGNQWFKDSLSSRFPSNTGFENFPAFLRHQKNQFRIKGKSFYQSAADPKLKKELVDDYVEMSWYQSINNLNRFLLFAFYQMENLLNYYLVISNAYEKIRISPDYYTHQYAPKFIIVVYDGFFFKSEKKAIESVNIWAKITYWMLDSNNKDWEEINHRNISNLISVRNANSHRSSNSNNEFVDSTIELLRKSDLSSLGFYYNVMKKILESYQTVDPTVKVLKVVENKPLLRGPKQVGFIDPSKFKK